MRQLNSKYLENEKIKELLKISQTEIDALDTYKFVGVYDIINELLGSYIPLDKELSDKNADERRKSNNPSSIPKELYYFGISNEAVENNLKKYMDVIKNIYSSMYKTAIINYSRRGNYGRNAEQKVGRGSSYSLLNDKDVGFISTSTLSEDSHINPYQESINWAIFNNLNKTGQVVSKISIAHDVPCVYVDGYVSGNKNESEVLISPFAKREKDEENGKYSNGTLITKDSFDGSEIRIKEEYVRVVNKPLTKMSKEEQRVLEEQLLSKSSELEKNTVRLLSNRKEIKELSDELFIERVRFSKAQGVTREDFEIFERNKKNKEEKMQSLSEENKALEKSILSWKSQFRQLMEAKCADIEVNIDNQIDMAINPIIEAEKAAENVRKEQERREKEETQKRLNAGINNGQILSDHLNKSLNSIYNSVAFRRLMQKQEDLNKAGFGQNSLISQLKNSIDGLGNDLPITYLGEDGVKNLEMQNGNKAPLFSRIMNMEKAIEVNAQSIIDRENNECKRKIIQDVLKIRAVQEGRKLLSTKNQIEGERLGLFGGTKKRQEERNRVLAQIDHGLLEIKNFIKNINDYGLNNMIRYEEIDGGDQISYEDDKSCGARTIMAELEIALANGTDGEERALLENLKSRARYVFNINENGVAKRYQKGMERYSKPDGPIAFLTKYDKLVNKKMQQEPSHPFVNEVRMTKEELNEVVRSSNREYGMVQSMANKQPLPFKPMERD